MYLRAVTFVLIGCALATAACSKSSSSATEESTAAASSAPGAMTEATSAASGMAESTAPAESTSSGPGMAETSAVPSAAASMAAAAPGAAPNSIDNVPVYPGAATQTSGAYNAGGGAAVQAVVLSTDDSFDKVYAWYQQRLSNATSTVHISTPPTPSATFMIAAPDNKGMTTVVIQTSNGKTTISIGQMKQ
jgi:hypothetical protein